MTIEINSKIFDYLFKKVSFGSLRAFLKENRNLKNDFETKCRLPNQFGTETLKVPLKTVSIPCFAIFVFF